jgi:hypothetical protein
MSGLTINLNYDSSVANADMTAGHTGAELLAAGSGDSLGTDTVYNFSQATGDRITGETAPQISTIVATQSTDANGNAVIQLYNGPTVTLVGIQHVDASFFG